jgi:hypothetical protein
MKTTININSKKPMVLLPLEDYEGMIETIEILSANANITEELKNEKKEFLKGNYKLHKPKTTSQRRKLKSIKKK